MSESSDQDIILDAAIETYSLAPLPSGFVDRVMAQVRQQPQVVVPPRFQLQFLDVALPAFMVLFASLVLTVGMWLAGRLDAAWLPQAPFSLAIAGQFPLSFGISAVVVLGEVMVAIMVGVMLWLDQPFLPVNRS